MNSSHEDQIRQYVDKVGTSEWAMAEHQEFQRTSAVAFNGRLPRTEMDTPSPQPGRVVGTFLHRTLLSHLQNSSTVSNGITVLPPAKPHITLCQMRTEFIVNGLPSHPDQTTESSAPSPSTIVPGAEMPTKMEEAEELAARMGVTLAELPDALIAAKEKLNEYAEQVNRFAEMFKTQPVSRRHRRAQRFGHHKLHG